MAGGTKTIGAWTFQHPLIRHLADLAWSVAGLQLTFVFPTDTGWDQISRDDTGEKLSDFCKLIQSTPEGRRECRMCHILMTVAACSRQVPQQYCHAGLEVVLAPAAGNADEAIGVLASCMFTRAAAWPRARARGAKLGVDPVRLRQAFLRLPRPDPGKREQVRLIMEAVVDAIGLLRHQAEREARLPATNGAPPVAPVTPFNTLLKATGLPCDPGLAGPDATSPLIIRVVCEMIRQHPEMAYSVKELAAAARLTPNHFTASFHRHTGKPFTVYLMEQRMERARQLLGDLTLTVSEVARLAGYDDAGYFARRFRRATRQTPRAWREQHFPSANPGSHS